MKEKEIKVLMVEPGKAPTVTTIKNDLRSLQEAVSIGAEYVGYIEIIGIDDDVCILCNEEGKLINLEPNRRFYNDVICGVFYVVGEDSDGNLTSLPEKFMKYYSNYFDTPEDLSSDDVDKAMSFNIFTDWEV